MSTPISMEGENMEPVNTNNGRLDDHLHSYVGSQPANEDNTHNDDNEIDEEVEKWTNENQENDIEEADDIIGKNKRKKKDPKFGMSLRKKGECVHCKKQILIGVTSATTQFKRHLDRCAARIRALKKQKILHFQPTDTENSFSQSNQDGGMLTTFKYDLQKVREMIAHYILINEKPFSIVEGFGFNLILKSMSPFFMTKKIKNKFDKYWGECNLLMAFGAVMDPRMKFVVIEFAYPMIYPGDESMRNMLHVRSLLYEMYEEYVTSFEAEMDGDSGIAGGSSRITNNSLQSVDHLTNSKKYSGWHDFTSYVSSKTSTRPLKRKKRMKRWRLSYQLHEKI
ncbi:hypothetical protein M5K25_022359 [Dendrobium thyrsiflorum]|uniref:hAT-like transposase RNase-H fold domain-containing protein n=1 Tax=Dendrobium thyrsiflorum TaxID=117978 RepID=A0ABD0U628_DENTH